MSQNWKKKLRAITVMLNLQLVKVFNLVTLIWYKMTEKSALSVIKSAIEKKNTVKVFETLLECRSQY